MRGKATEDGTPLKGAGITPAYAGKSAREAGLKIGT